MKTFTYNYYVGSRRRGFILPFTMLLTALILLVALTGSRVISKQLFFSKIYKQSQLAYYSADDALACAISIDDAYIGADGYGIFPGGTTTDPTVYMDEVIDTVNTQRLHDGLQGISLSDIKCAQVAVFDPAIGNNKPEFYVDPVDFENPTDSGIEYGKTSSFKMAMPVGDGEYRCAKVTVHKTPSFRQIISQGYAACNGDAGSVERAVVNTSVVE